MTNRPILTRRSAVNFAATISIRFRLIDEPQEVLDRQAQAAPSDTFKPQRTGALAIGLISVNQVEKPEPRDDLLRDVV